MLASTYFQATPVVSIDTAEGPITSLLRPSEAAGDAEGRAGAEKADEGQEPLVHGSVQ